MEVHLSRQLASIPRADSGTKVTARCLSSFAEAKREISSISSSRVFPVKCTSAMALAPRIKGTHIVSISRTVHIRISEDGRRKQKPEAEEMKRCKLQDGWDEVVFPPVLPNQLSRSRSMSPNRSAR